MIKLTDLLEAEKAFTATSKETGNVAVFKTKAARDAAVKAGSHEKRKTDKDDAVDVPTGDDKPNMFSKDAGYDAPDDDKSKKSKPKLDNAYDAKDFESIVSSLKGKVSDKDYSEIKDALESLENLQYDLEDIDRDEDNEEWAMQKDTIDVEVDDLKGLIKQALSKDKKSKPKSASGGGMDKDSVNQTKSYLDKELGLDGTTSLTSNGEIKYSVLGTSDDVFIGKDGDKFSVSIGSPDPLRNKTIKSSEKSFDNEKDAMAYAKELGQKVKDDTGLYDKEEPKSEPTKDSTVDRAGNPKINKAVRKKAQELGITPQKLGKEEYESRMSKAAVEALTDANFHSEARKLISILEDKPEWDSNPMNDPDKPKDVFSKEYDEWRKNTVFSSELYDSAEGTDEIAHLATNQSGWEGETSVDAIAFDLKMNGSKKLAAKIQSIFEGTTKRGFKNQSLKNLM